jgi:hypothetical protein
MASVGNPIRWLSDVTPAAWVITAVDGSYDFVSALVPPRYQAYARLIHSGDWLGGSLPLAQRRVLVDLLRGETTTPERCWFCVPDDNHDLDDQGVGQRVDLPSGGTAYLLHGGSIELALMPPPERSHHVPVRLDLTDEEMREELAAELAAAEGVSVTFTVEDASLVELAQAVSDACPFLAHVGPGLWWPDDRAWFVGTDSFEKRTWVGGSRRLIERLLAEPALAATEAHATDDIDEIRRIAMTPSEPPPPAQDPPPAGGWHWSPPFSRWRGDR